MVLFLLYLKADLENVDCISLNHGANLCFNIRNPLSDFEKREKVVVDTSEYVAQEEGSREPPFHFGLKWEGSKKMSVLTILDEAATKTALKKKKGVAVRDYNADDSGNWVPILAIECRGLEPTEFFPIGGEFTVKSNGGKEFSDDVDLSEGDWAEYDEENDEPVSLSEIEFKLEAC